MAEEKLKPIHPGEVLLEEFLEPNGLSQNRVALDIGVPARRINAKGRPSGIEEGACGNVGYGSFEVVF